MNLEDLLTKWQRRLRLLDWNIEVREVKGNELDSDQFGSVRWNNNHKDALILVRSEDTWPAITPPVKGWTQEHTLVHELIHIKMWYDAENRRNETEDTVLERTINDITKALIRLDKSE